MKMSPYRDAYLDNESLAAYCPNFKNLNRAEKLRAWTWFWMVLANEESTCSSEALHPTHAKVNGRWVRLNPRVGYGLFAAEFYGGDRRWRGPACEGNIKDRSLQVRCAVDTMYSRHLEKGSLSDESSYWGPIRRDTRQIKPNMKLFEPCFKRTRAPRMARAG